MALTKGCSGAPPGRPDRLAEETHNSGALTWTGMSAA